MRMDFLILTETEFFRLVNSDSDCRKLNAAYREFINKVFTFCCSAPSDLRQLVGTLVYTEIELSSLHEKLTPHGDYRACHARKAVSFIRRMLKHLQTQVPPLSTPKSDVQSAPFRWTGSLVELVEIIYALNEIGCINDGCSDIKELTAYFGSLLGLEIKDSYCYNAYSDMKRRKSESRTYFLDKLRERLNLRMQRDDAREQMRR